MDALAEDLCRKLLRPDPSERLSAQAVREHPFFRAGDCVGCRIKVSNQGERAGARDVSDVADSTEKCEKDSAAGAGEASTVGESGRSSEGTVDTCCSACGGSGASSRVPSLTWLSAKAMCAGVTSGAVSPPLLASCVGDLPSGT